MDYIDDLMDSIRKQLDGLSDFGQLQLHIKKHLGEVNVHPDMVKITSIKFTDNEPNVTATSAIFQMIKALQETKETGTLSFTINMKQGHAETMQVQDFRKI